MKLKSTKLIAIASIIAIISTGCSKKNDNTSQDEYSQQNEVSENFETKDNLMDILSTNKEYANYNDLVKESKKNVEEFSKWLNKYNIENSISEDGYSVENINTEYEKNNIKYKSKVFLDSSISGNNNIYYGLSKVYLKYQSHIQEEYTKDNEFIKLVFDVVKGYNENITIDDLTKELNDYIKGEIGVLSFNNDVVNISLTNENTIKTLTMSFENQTKPIELNAPVKEYETMKDFINDSKELAQKIKEKIAKLDVDKNFVVRNGREIDSSSKSEIYMMANVDGDLYQKISIDMNLDRDGEGVISFNDESLEIIYSILEDVYGEELAKYCTLEDFKIIAHRNTLEYDGDIDTKNVSDLITILPYLKEQAINIRNNVNSKHILKENIYYGNNNSQELLDMVDSFEDGVLSKATIKMEIIIPVKAEGITKFTPGYNNDKFVLDDGTEFDAIDTRN